MGLRISGLRVYHRVVPVSEVTQSRRVWKSYDVSRMKISEYKRKPSSGSYFVTVYTIRLSCSIVGVLESNLYYLPT